MPEKEPDSMKMKMLVSCSKKLPDNPLEFAGGHLDHCRVVGLRDSKMLL